MGVKIGRFATFVIVIVLMVGWAVLGARGAFDDWGGLRRDVAGGEWTMLGVFVLVAVGVIALIPELGKAARAITGSPPKDAQPRGEAQSPQPAFRVTVEREPTTDFIHVIIDTLRTDFFEVAVTDARGVVEEGRKQLEFPWNLKWRLDPSRQQQRWEVRPGVLGKADFVEAQCGKGRNGVRAFSTTLPDGWMLYFAQSNPRYAADAEMTLYITVWATGADKHIDGWIRLRCGGYREPMQIEVGGDLSQQSTPDKSAGQQ